MIEFIREHLFEIAVVAAVFWIWNSVLLEDGFLWPALISAGLIFILPRVWPPVWGFLQAYKYIIFIFGVVYAVWYFVLDGDGFLVPTLIAAALMWGLPRLGILDFKLPSKPTAAQVDYGKSALKDTGVCQSFAEDAYFVALFVNDDESSWSQKEIDHIMNDQMREALDFIIKKASEYGHELTLNYGYHQVNGISEVAIFDGDFYGGSDMREIPAKDGTVLEQAAKALGYESSQEMLKSDRKTTGVDQIAYIVFLNKSGRAHAVTDWDRELVDNDIEYAVIYTSYVGNAFRTTPRGIAHESMHLFGAEDYYRYPETGQYDKRSKMAEKLCPTDIMYGGSEDLRKVAVGRYTAYCVGWLDEMPEEYDQPDWWE